ncbi:transposable element Tcb2 transposase [Trichonephila clavipes]|nr:transposable element Tcb2 transposase [Trichonephila clavipes]
MFLAGHPSHGCFGLQSHCAPCYFFNQASFYPYDFSFSKCCLHYTCPYVLGILRSSSSHPRQTSRREDHHIIRNACVQRTASSAAIQEQVVPSLGAPVSSRTIRKRLAEGHLRSRRPLRVLPLTPNHRLLCLEWCRAPGNWIAVEWKQVVFRDESRFNLCSDDNRVHVGRAHDEHLNHLFVLQRHTAPTAGVMV